jgi:nucleoside-diphosphate-sugar epimerase
MRELVGAIQVMPPRGAGFIGSHIIDRLVAAGTLGSRSTSNIMFLVRRVDLRFPNEIAANR